MKFINITEAELNQIGSLYHYTGSLRILDEMQSHYLWFSNALLWKGSSEARFLTSWYAGTRDNAHPHYRHPLIKDSFGMSFFINPIDQNRWQYYASGNRDSVEVVYKREQLIEFLKSLEGEGYKVVIGKVKPFTFTTFANTFAELKRGNFNIEDYLDLLFYVNEFQRNTEEIRIFILPQDWQNSPRLRSTVGTENQPLNTVVEAEKILYDLPNEELIETVKDNRGRSYTADEYMQMHHVTDDLFDFSDNFGVEPQGETRAITDIQSQTWQALIRH